MPAPRKLPLAAYDRIEVMQARAETPTDKELAKELDCSVCLIQHVMQRARKGQGVISSRGTPEEVAEAAMREMWLA